MWCGVRCFCVLCGAVYVVCIVVCVSYAKLGYHKINGSHKQHTCIKKANGTKYNKQLLRDCVSIREATVWKSTLFVADPEPYQASNACGKSGSGFRQCLCHLLRAYPLDSLDCRSSISNCVVSLVCLLVCHRCSFALLLCSAPLLLALFALLPPSSFGSTMA